MSHNGDFAEDDREEDTTRNFTAPYTSHHPIPTVQKYRAQRDELDQQQKKTEEAQHDEEDDSNVKRAYHSAKAILKGKDGAEKSDHDPYPTGNRNVNGGASGQDQPNQETKTESTQSDVSQKGDAAQGTKQDRDTAGSDGKKEKSATETVAGRQDPRQKRKDMKHMKRDDGGREVTDPVTHLPIVIQDSTTKDLDHAPENEAAAGTEAPTKTGVDGRAKSNTQLDREQKQGQSSRDGMQRLFPPPNFEDTKAELARTYRVALTVTVSVIIGLMTLALVVIQLFNGSAIFGGKVRPSKSDSTWAVIFSQVTPILATVIAASVLGVALVTNVQGWLGKKVEEIWDDEVWDAARQQETQTHESDTELPESVAWMNSLLASVWPLINPDLFTSISDMLEDVMQASLPKVVRMVSVDDLGQGNEAFRILGIKWLPTGAASRSVDDEGNLESNKKQQESDRVAPGQGQQESDENPDQGQNEKDDEDQNEDESEKQKNENKQKEQEKEAIREGMEAEQGDFVNMELAFAYRARSSGKSLKTKAKNAHLYLKFYLPGGLAVPVWVEMRGIVGTMRMRLQLTPDPPFFSLCTLTFLGQPRADLSCVPLSKHSLNIMDVPLISSFVQSSIDAALAEYVAPKSLTLDLKDMLVGDDFKKDTNSRGVVMIYLKQARGFKEGDGGVGPMKGSSDSYLTVSWGKFGKPVASTRIIVDDQAPNWHEWSSILVSAEELNAQEKLRIQLWDSDKYTADDDLGRVEVDLHELMHSPKTKNKMFDREDRFVGEDPDEKMPGTVAWSVGYFAKTKITEEQLAKQTDDENIKSKEDLKNQVSETAKRKLREATLHDESKELDQQKREDYKEREDALMISSPPPNEYPCGIFSIQIHNITGLEVQKLQKQGKNENADREDEAEQNNELPSSYATIMLNHQRIYRTRTKPKNAKPFFNAGTERFVRDWKTTEVMVSVRDDREKEDDAMLGMVYLPLRKVFAKRSQIVETYPLAGGIGYGRARISMVWRSVELKLPQELSGWDYGTIEVQNSIRWKGQIGSTDLKGYRIRIRTNLGKGKMAYEDNEGGQWAPKHGKSSIFLAVRKRYSSAVVIEFRKSALGPDSTPAFAVFWLKDIPDEESKTITMKVWKGSKDGLKRATSSCDYQGTPQKNNDEQKGHAKDEELGEIDVPLKFWRGLSGFHKRWANKSNNAGVKDTMEVLDTVGDEGENNPYSSDSSDSSDSGSESDANSTKKTKRKLRTHTNQSSDEDSDGDAAGGGGKTSILKHPVKKVKDTVTKQIDKGNDAEDGSRGPLNQIRDYKGHHRQLHRQHRGVMQWQGARTLDWMAGKVKRGTGKMGSVFEHSEKDTGVETEV